METCDRSCISIGITLYDQTSGNIGIPEILKIQVNCVDSDCIMCIGESSHDSALECSICNRSVMGSSLDGDGWLFLSFV